MTDELPPLTTTRYEPPLDDLIAGLPGRQSAGEDNRFDAPQIIHAASFNGVEPPPRRWLVPKVIPASNVTLIYGDGAAGKSTLILQLADAVTSGNEWLGLETAKGPAIVFSAEDDKGEMHRRLTAAAKMRGGDLSPDLHLIDVSDRNDSILGAPGASGIIIPTRLWQWLVAQAERIKPRLLVIDPIADVFGGDEIKRREARQFMTMLRSLAIRQETAVVALAHPSQAGMNSGEGTSGSTAWSNSCRSRMYLAAEQKDRDARILTLKKLNWGPPRLRLHLRWRDGCYIVESQSSSSASKQTIEAKAERIFCDLLSTFLADGRNVSPNSGSNYAASVFAKHPSAAGVTKKGFADAMNRLFQAKRICVDKFGPPSRQVTRIVFTAHQKADCFDTPKEDET